MPKRDICYLLFTLIQHGKGKGKTVAGNELSISDFLPSKNTQGDVNARKNVKTPTTLQGDEQEARPTPQPSSRKAAADGNAKNTQSNFQICVQD